MINLAPVLFDNMTVTFMDITKCSKGIPSFSNKKNSDVENDEMTVTFSSTIPVTPSLCKTIVVPYVDINAKVTNFFPFCTIGISMYQIVFYLDPVYLRNCLFLNSTAPALVPAMIQTRHDTN